MKLYYPSQIAPFKVGTASRTLTLGCAGSRPEWADSFFNLNRGIQDRFLKSLWGLIHNIRHTAQWYPVWAIEPAKVVMSANLPPNGRGGSARRIQ